MGAISKRGRPVLESSVGTSGLNRGRVVYSRVLTMKMAFLEARGQEKQMHTTSLHMGVYLD